MEDELGIKRMLRGIPPSHYLFKIESFSLLVKTKVEMYKSDAFQTGGHEWRLVLYPNGNKKRKGNGYISLYLEIQKTQNFSFDWEVNVDFKLFVFDQIWDQYLVIQDSEVPVKRFYEMKTEWGFSQLLSQETFKNAANGYLVDDCCIFGAEVFVLERPRELEQLSMIENPIGGTITWKIENFSKFNLTSYCSPENFVDDIKWNLLVYPKGYSSGKDTHLSLFLHLAEPSNLPPKRELYVKYKLRLRDQIKSNHLESIVENWFSSSKLGWGYLEFVSLKDLNDSAKGYMVKDTVIVEAEFLVISKVKCFSFQPQDIFDVSF